jgi:hypothetical protein
VGPTSRRLAHVPDPLFPHWRTFDYQRAILVDELVVESGEIQEPGCGDNERRGDNGGVTVHRPMLDMAGLSFKAGEGHGLEPDLAAA